MPNIKFNYRYRDGSNYKNHGSAIFSNPQNIELPYLKKLIKSKLIDETWFYANQWKLPNLYFTPFDPETDPTWHEFENIEYTEESANTLLSLTEFIKCINGSSLK